MQERLVRALLRRVLNGKPEKKAKGRWGGIGRSRSTSIRGNAAKDVATGVAQKDLEWQYEELWDLVAANWERDLTALSETPLQAP